MTYGRQEAEPSLAFSDGFRPGWVLKNTHKSPVAFWKAGTSLGAHASGRSVSTLHVPAETLSNRLTFPGGLPFPIESSSEDGVFLVDSSILGQHVSVGHNDHCNN